MLDRVKDAVKGRAKRLLRQGDQSEPSSPEQESFASNNAREVNGDPKTAPQTSQQLPIRNSNPAHNGARGLPNTDRGSHLAAAEAYTPSAYSPASTPGLREHPAVHPSTAEHLVPRAPTTADPRGSHTAPMIPPLNFVDDRSSTSSESSVSDSRKSSQHAIEKHQIPERTSSKRQAHLLHDQLYKSSPIGVAQKDPQISTVGTIQLGDKPGEPNPFALQRSDVTVDQLQSNLANLTVNPSENDKSVMSTAIAKADSKAKDLRTTFDAVYGHIDVDFDHTVHQEKAVTHEEIKPHVHTIIEPKRTRSYHYHEHNTIIQPIADPDPPTVLPAQHWAQHRITGEIFKIPDELGRQLTELEEKK
ncbi:hypothetical protein G7046_g1321 [Stylonectria norvegica]|nr:hypothetical protein G7046_g1321 [Stylonectria norvegica]